MSKEFGENLFKWQNYVRYLLLTAGVFFIHYLTDIWGIEKLVVDGVWYGWIVLFFFYAIGLTIVDTIIQAIFWYAPKPIQWKD